MKRFFVLSVFTVLFGIMPHSAEAHAITDVGPYSIIVGWEIEPPIVGERNTMYVDLLYEGQLVSAQDSVLNLQLLFGDQAKKVIPTQNPETGRYRVTFIPTVAGEFSFQINGTAGDQAIDIIVTPEPVEEPIALQFPEIALTNVELQNVITSLETSNAAARQQSQIALIIGVVGIILALSVGIYTARRSS